MHVALHAFLLFLSVTVQLLIAPLFSIGNLAPDFLLIVIISISLKKGRIWGVGSGFITGLILDLLGTGIVGLSSLTKSLSAYLAGFLVGERSQRRVVLNAGLLFLVLLIHDLLYFLVLNIGASIGFWNVLVRHAIPTSIYTLSFMIIIYLFRPRVLRGGSGVTT